MAIKPILMNSEMVRAILDGRKTCTRRLPKKNIETKYLEYEEWVCAVAPPGSTWLSEKEFYEKYPPYQPGDILYVRETWERFECRNCEGDNNGNCPKNPQESVLNRTCGCYMYRATDEIRGDTKWHPSIHMPKEAARIWLRVTDVRVEQLKEITEDGALREGAQGVICDHVALGEHGCTDCMNTGWLEPPQVEFMQIWNSTIKKPDFDRYGWDANPWVWVVEFERCEKPEGV